MRDVDVTARVGGADDAMWADDRWVYFRQPHQASAQVLARVGVAGGDIEVISNGPRAVFAVTSDACNVYWLAGASFAVLP